MGSRWSFAFLAVGLGACAVDSSGLRAAAPDDGGEDADRMDAAAAVDARVTDAASVADTARASDAGCPACDAGCEATGSCPECVIDRDCPAPTLGDFSACVPDGECAETGTRTRRRTDYACASGACVGTDTVETQSCEAMTDGDPCRGDGLGCTIDECAGGACTHRCDGASICTCNPGTGCTCI